MKSRMMRSVGALALVALSGGALLAAEQTVGTGKDFKGPVGLQLYSLRDSFKQDVPGTLDKVQAMGFKYVELAGTYGITPAAFRQELEARGLVPVAGHFSFEQYDKNVDAVIREATALGLQYVGCAWVPHQGDFTEMDAHRTIEVFNRAGRALAAHGLKFYYHNHGYEFQPHGKSTLMDFIIRGTDPEYVAFQMDLLWTKFPGEDPAKWLAKYPGRWVLMHLKDLKKGVEGNLSGGTDVRNDVTLGTGQIDFANVLKAAKASGTKWYFIEDESPSVEIQVPNSLRFLEQLAW
ncbi:MAG: TIM barrel protein [Verrucomicrobiales bacterium]|nr:TIM barrel protein [Verrucomicrobiales bacterium]MCP5526294.1 TIM barrel protein [Verrucomicrobiales bacterium]